MWPSQKNLGGQKINLQQSKLSSPLPRTSGPSFIFDLKMSNSVISALERID